MVSQTGFNEREHLENFEKSVDRTFTFDIFFGN